MTTQHKSLKSYFFPTLLLCSILLGGLTGYLLGPSARSLKPLGDIFLNLILTAIVPLIFFSVSSAVARTGLGGKLGKILLYMIVVFIFTSTIAALYMMFVVKLFPPAYGINLQLPLPEKITTSHVSDQIAHIFTVSDFSKLLSHEHILALIVFSILVGLATSTASEKGKVFLEFLRSGEEIFMRVFSFIMYYAPIGFFAYFAVILSELGPRLIEGYFRVTAIYYAAGVIYFICALSIYAYLAGKIVAVKLFWKNIFLPSVTAVATSSSAASIPANLVAAQKMYVPSEIYETTIPLGAIIHKDGSAMGGMVKIAFLFGIFHLKFAGINTLLTALGVSLLVGTVMGAITSGGMLGELLILAFYGFPSSILIAIAAISIIIDPLATLLNVTGNTASSMMIARLVDGKNWLVRSTGVRP